MTGKMIGVCEADRVNRTNTFHVREGFGDGTDGYGLRLANPDSAERESATRTFLQAIDVILDKRERAPIERWTRLRFKEDSMTLEEATAQLERRIMYVHEFERGESREPSVAPTGEPYVTMMSGGIRSGDETATAMCRTPEVAVQLWSDAVQRYYCDRVEASGGRADNLQLYWRIRPEVEEGILYAIFKDPPQPDITVGVTWYSVYSRMLISATPVKD